MPAPPTCLVVFHFPGPAWVAGMPMFGQPGLQAHIDHYRSLLESGHLGAGGPFLDGDGGGMMIIQPGMPMEELVEFAGGRTALDARHAGTRRTGLNAGRPAGFGAATLPGDDGAASALLVGLLLPRQALAVAAEGGDPERLVLLAFLGGRQHVLVVRVRLTVCVR